MTMHFATNADLYLVDPRKRTLINQGVASVNDDASELALRTLRYELETFVCDGQYARGLELILETFLKNLHAAQQPAAWVSGYYGSGKSHLVKMLRALWMNVPFSDGATPRGLAHLPDGIRDLLLELDAEGKKAGGRFAAAGTLSSGGKQDVRLDLLQLVHRAASLPASYHQARFVLWLEKEGVLEAVRRAVEASGHDWEEELRNFRVARALREALMKALPGHFESIAQCGAHLNAQFPQTPGISQEEMLGDLRDVLARVSGDRQKLPLTLLVLDEVQQYIGDSAQRSLDVQEMVEAVSKNLGGRVLFVGTGQTAITGTANLGKLQGRFTVRVELSDADVDVVLRRVILAKKPGAVPRLDQLAQDNLGEISRHLSATSLRHRQDDLGVFAQDYPILPVRRRFWEHALRALDRTGTDSQLRNRLGMVHKAVAAHAQAPVGCVLPADLLYFELAEKLLQSRTLPRNVYEQIQKWQAQGADEKLLARACGLIFLIGRIKAMDPQLGLSATVDVLADLLVEDLAAGSAGLRRELERLLPNCALVMRIGSEYVIQSREAGEWNDEFEAESRDLQEIPGRVDILREERLKKAVSEKLKTVLTLSHGKSKVRRDVELCFDAQLPREAGSRLLVWVRSGWSESEGAVREAARAAGPRSHVIFAFVPRESADELRSALIQENAARTVLDRRRTRQNEEVQEARAAMETRADSAKKRVEELLDALLSRARVFKGGGDEVLAASFPEAVRSALQDAVERLYPKFSAADHPGWARVLERAQKGAPDAIESVDHRGKVEDHPVCRAIRDFLASPHRGSDVQRRFEAPPYGWPKDAIDAALVLLLSAGILRATDEAGHAVSDPSRLERRKLPATTFSVETVTVSAPQKLAVRGLCTHLGISCKPGEEAAAASSVLEELERRAAAAGGEPPLPAPPDGRLLEELRDLSGNALLVRLAQEAEALKKWADELKAVAERIRSRRPAWETLSQMLEKAAGLPQAEDIRQSARAIEAGRALLSEPDPVAPLLDRLTQAVRARFQELQAQYRERRAQLERELERDGNWVQLSGAERDGLLADHGLAGQDEPALDLQDPGHVLSSLARHPLSGLENRVAALSGRFDAVRLGAARLREPQVQDVPLGRAVLHDEAELEAWLEETRRRLREALQRGPVMPR